jgi:uncharacterized protein YggU (UPF0235/DUF167 family)
MAVPDGQQALSESVRSSETRLSAGFFLGVDRVNRADEPCIRACPRRPMRARPQRGAGAKRTEAVGLHDGALRLRLAAPPVDGKANDACCLAGQQLGRAAARLQLLRGTTPSRRKQVMLARGPARAQLSRSGFQRACRPRRVTRISADQRPPTSMACAVVLSAAAPRTSSAPQRGCRARTAALRGGQPARGRFTASAPRKASAASRSGVDDLAGRDAGTCVRTPCCHSSQPRRPSVTTTPLRCERDSDSRLAGAFAQHARLVVVDRDQLACATNAAQLGASNSAGPGPGRR